VKDESFRKNTKSHGYRNEISDSSSIYFEVWENLEKIMATGENIPSGWWKIFRRSPLVTACRKKRQREAR